MIAAQAAAGLARPLDRICHVLWLAQRREPEVVELARDRGSLGFPHYLASRGGPVPDRRWADLLYVVPDSLVDHLRARCRELNPPEYVDLALEAAGRALRRLQPGNPPSALETAARACRSGHSLAAGWSRWERTGDTHRDALRDAMVLRENRAAGHYQAAGEAGLDRCQLLVLTSVWSGQTVEAIPASFRWGEADVREAVAALEQRGWLGSGELTEAGAGARRALEERTNQLAATYLEHCPEGLVERLGPDLEQFASF